MKTDTKFFTNCDSDSLLARFKDTLVHTRYFDVLVGYFRASGFATLAQSLKDVEKIRILVGLNTDFQIYDTLSQNSNNLQTILHSHDEIRKSYAQTVQQEMETAPEEQGTENSVSLFLKFIKEKKLELRGHPSRDIHAKVYIMRYHEDQIASGSVITGSSNFSYSGFTAQREFNVELKDPNDVGFALEKFQILWDESVELTEEFVLTITQKTWFNENISPYELYLKFLYEYFKEDINSDNETQAMLPEGFSSLEYQRQSVTAAIKILQAHNGVFLSDVVGLGKTYISAMILQQLSGPKLIICPPVLKDYWEDVLRNFYVHPFKVISPGKLEDIFGSNFSKYQYVLVDESHKFRNELTKSYEQLKNICIGKKVILVSATPFNNKLGDLLAQIKLFQSGKRSTIPGVSNLEAFFKKQERELKFFTPGTKEYKDEASKIAAIVRDKVLKHIMIRRTRSEVVRYFSEDIKKQGLHFPKIANPIPLSYQFDTQIETAFQETIKLLIGIHYARYTPLLYLKSGPTKQQKHSQNNARGFIKSILVKRLESSFYAFRETINRFVKSYTAFIEAYEEGYVYIGKGLDIAEFLEYDNLEEFNEFIESKDIAQYDAEDFTDQFYEDLISDKTSLQKIYNIWNKIDKDPKYDNLVKNINSNDLIKDQRLLIFTESKETAEYLYKKLDVEFPNICMVFSSQRGIYKGISIHPQEARRFIQRNLDPASDEKLNDFRILITTDVLSEGMNLHLAGRIINYDLPWNPTRIMQRVGRINRVGSEYDTLYIFNFFPTAQADAHLGLEANIQKKLTEFNAVLGNDSKFLYLEEEPDPHGLFGRLSVITEEENEDSELQYLLAIRQVRDNNPELLKKIKQLPVKARSSHNEGSVFDSLLVFFREGYLKRFILIGGDKENIKELTFLEAASHFKCSPTALRCALPENYYQRLLSAKQFLSQQDINLVVTKSIDTRNTKLLSNIRALQHYSSMTDIDQEYLQILYTAVQNATLGKRNITNINNAIKKANSPIVALNTLRKIIPSDILLKTEQITYSNQSASTPRQIVLTQYLAPRK